MRWLMMGILGLLCVIGLNGTSAMKANDNCEDLEELMETIGSKKKGVHYKIEAELKKDKTNWEEISKMSKTYADLSAKVVTFKVKSGTKESWEKLSKEFAANAKTLNEAAGKKDAKAATAALDKLTTNCKDCHDAHR